MLPSFWPKQASGICFQTTTGSSSSSVLSSRIEWSIGERVSERVTNAATAKKPTDARTTRKRQRKHPHRKSIHPARAARAPRAPSFLLLPVASPKTGRTVGLCGPAYSLASTSQSVRIRWSYRSVRLFGCAFGLELGVAGDNAFR